MLPKKPHHSPSLHGSNLGTVRKTTSVNDEFIP